VVQLVALVLVAAQAIVSGVTQGPPRDRVAPRTGTGVIKGRVVDGTTGAALARARVMVQGIAAGASATTDAAGAFTLSGLPAGAVTLIVQKSTYLQARYPSAGRTIRAQGRPFILRDGQVVDDIVIQMFHGGSIAGRVVDVNGDPVEGAQVSLMRIPAVGRTGKPTVRGGTQTNDLGEYRFGRLDPGSYVVQATARREPDMMFAGPNAPPPQTTIESQPVPTFYPNVLALDQAQPLVVDKAQAIANADIVLAEGIPGVVNGTVLTADGQPIAQNTYPMIMIRRVLSDVTQGFDFSPGGANTRPDGTFRAVLAPGEYMFEARLMPRNGSPSRTEEEQLASARVSVVSGSEQMLNLTVGPGATATGRVVFEGTTPPPPTPGRVHVPMTSDGGMCRGAEAEVSPDWSFKIQGLTGTCSAPPSVMFGRWTLKAVTVNGQNLLDGPVTFQPGQQFRNVQVVVTDRQSSMVFQVTDENGQSTRDYVVLVYPVDKDRWTSGARPYIPPNMMNSDSMRPANLPGPAPSPPRPPSMGALRAGEYYVIAVDDLEPDDLRDPAVLDRLRGSATRVAMTDGSAVEVVLRRVSFAEVMRQK
jgi:carboxypeptidase family protein